MKSHIIVLMFGSVSLLCYLLIGDFSLYGANTLNLINGILGVLCFFRLYSRSKAKGEQL